MSTYLTAQSGYAGRAGALFDPTKVTTATLQAWWNADDLSLGVLGGAGEALPIARKGGLYDITGTVGSVSVQAGGGPHFSHDGGQHFYCGAAGALFSNVFTAINQPIHVFAALVVENWVSAGRVFLASSADGNGLQALHGNVAYELEQFGGSNQTNTVQATAVGSPEYLWEGYFNGNTSHQRLNNAAVVEDGINIGSKTMNRIIFGGIDTGSTYSDIRINDMVVFSGAEVTGDDYANLRDNFYNKKYGFY